MHKKCFNTLNNALRKQSIKVDSESLTGTTSFVAKGKNETYQRTEVAASYYLLNDKLGETMVTQKTHNANPLKVFATD